MSAIIAYRLKMRDRCCWVFMTSAESETRAGKLRRSSWALLMSEHNDSVDTFVANNADSLWHKYFKFIADSLFHISQFHVFVLLLFYLNLIGPTVLTLSVNSKK